MKLLLGTFHVAVITESGLLVLCLVCRLPKAVRLTFWDFDVTLPLVFPPINFLFLFFFPLSETVAELYSWWELPRTQRQLAAAAWRCEFLCQPAGGAHHGVRL